MHEVGLESLGCGAAAELFGLELRKVLANIADPNTPALAKREIHLSVSIKPSADRSYGTVQISCHSRLAQVQPHESAFFMGLVEGGIKAFEQDTTQPELGLGNKKIIPMGGKQA